MNIESFNCTALCDGFEGPHFETLLHLERADAGFFGGKGGINVRN